MKCPNCEVDDNKVHKTYTEQNFMMAKNLRVRHCYNCGYFFNTEEAVYGDTFRYREGHKVPKKDEKQSSLFD